MKLESLLLMLSNALMPWAAQAPKVDRIVAFGDSLSDTSNISKYLAYLLPRPPYYKFRFSNGPIWLEYLAESTNLQLENFSYGGAESGTQIFNTDTTTMKLEQKIVGNMLSEVEKFVKPQIPCKHFTTEYCEPRNNNLFVIWIGGNNYMNRSVTPAVLENIIEDPGNIEYVQRTVADIKKSLDILYKSGAQHFLVPNLPDLGKIPWACKNNKVKILSELSFAHNKYLKAMLDDFRARNTKARVFELDVQMYFEQIQDLKAQFEIEDVTQPCYSGPYTGSDDKNLVCKNPSSFLFWDQVHPTTHVHSLISKFALELLNKSGILN